MQLKYLHYLLYSKYKMKKTISSLFFALITSLTCLSATSIPTKVIAATDTAFYKNKYVWSYADLNSTTPLPWSMFKPNSFSSVSVTFKTNATSVGTSPIDGEHPRMFFSAADLPKFRQRISVAGSAAYNAWMNVLAYANALKMTYNINANYAKPDWMAGSFGIRGRVPLQRIGGYANREDYYTILANGSIPASQTWPVMQAASAEALRCIVENDSVAAKTLAKVLVTATQMEQARRAANDKVVAVGQPVNVSTSRMWAIGMGMAYDFIYNWMTPTQKQFLHDELVTISAWQDNYGTFNNADYSRSNWATFSYWTFDLMSLESETGFNNLKYKGLYRSVRNFMTNGYFDSGAIFEGEGKSLMALDAVATYDRVATKYGLQPLSQHPVIENHFGNFTALSVLPTQTNFVLFDIIGGMGKDLCTPLDVVMAKYYYPNNPKIDFVYRTVVGTDYHNFPNRMDNNWNGVIMCAIFAMDYNPAQPTPQALNLPLSFFCGQRALMLTRSGWDTDASFLTMHVRGASGGHPYRDRNGIMFTGKGRSWITIPYHGGENWGWACSTVLIDGREQSNTTPGRVVDYVDNANATFMVGDAKYCWDWVWDSTTSTFSGTQATFTDLANNNVDFGYAWQPVEQSFNDFAYTKNTAALYSQPMKMAAHWLLPDGYVESRKRQVNTPVIKSFRTSGLVRGTHPYTLIIDDIQRNAMAARYDWNITLMSDVVRVTNLPTGCQASDIVLGGSADITSGSLKTNASGLLIRVLDQNGAPVSVQLKMNIGQSNEQINVLTLSTQAISPNYKIMMFPFRNGEALPSTTWNTQRNQVTVTFSDQTDLVTFTPAASGKTDVVITRNGTTIVAVNKMVTPLADPQTDALNAALALLPEKLKNVPAFNPDNVPGLIASWTLDSMVINGTDSIFPAKQSNIPAISAKGATIETGIINNAARFPFTGVSLPYYLNTVLPNPTTSPTAPNRNNFTISLWVKSDPALTGTILNINGSYGLAMDLMQGKLRYSAQGKYSLGANCSAQGLIAWTHFAVTSADDSVRFYKDGLRVMTVKRTQNFDFNSAIRLSHLFYITSGDPFKGVYDDIRIYNRALDASNIELISLTGNYGPALRMATDLKQSPSPQPKKMFVKDEVLYLNSEAKSIRIRALNGISVIDTTNRSSVLINKIPQGIYIAEVIWRDSSRSIEKIIRQ